MNKIKQIIALLGVILLIGMYCTTIIMAILSSKYFFDFLMASMSDGELQSGATAN